MDAFESVIATILDRDGFWVRTSYKVALNKTEKLEINRPSSPRWELDVIAYRHADNLLWIVSANHFLTLEVSPSKGSTLRREAHPNTNCLTSPILAQ